MLRKITNSGLLAARPSPLTVPNTYYFATDENKYYSAEGEQWVEREVDVNDITPEAEAVLNCGLSYTGAIDPIKVGASPVINKSGTIASAGVSQTVSNANVERRYFIFQNVSDTDMYVSVGSSAAVGSGFLISKNGGSLTCDSFVPIEQINVACSSSAKAFTAFEA